MSALIKSLKFHSIINKNPSILYTAARNHWNKDYKPSKFPETEEERRAAAKKYGLHPSEYKPYPDDGMGYGDYPHLPDVPIERKDPYYPYDYPELKRNFQEPIHAEIDTYDETRYGTPNEPRFSMTTQVTCLFSVLGGTWLLYEWFEDKKIFEPVLPQQMPAPGVVHYTFEPKS